MESSKGLTKIAKASKQQSAYEEGCKLKSESKYRRLIERKEICYGANKSYWAAYTSLPTNHESDPPRLKKDIQKNRNV